MNIVVIVLDSMHVHSFHSQMVAGAEMSLFFEINSELKSYPLYSGNISKDFTIDNMMKTGIHRYLVKKNVWIYFKMFIGLLRICAIRSFGSSLASNYKTSIKRVPLHIQTCQTRPTLININSDKTLFYAFTVSANKFGGSCNTIDDPYARVCIPNKVKNINVKSI